MVKATSSYSVPRFGVGTKARPVWVMTYDWASGKTTKYVPTQSHRQDGAPEVPTDRLPPFLVRHGVAKPTPTRRSPAGIVSNPV